MHHSPLPHLVYLNDLHLLKQVMVDPKTSILLDSRPRQRSRKICRCLLDLVAVVLLVVSYL